MKMYLVIAAALLTMFAANASAVEIDITNDENRDFLMGYEREYPNCSVVWWASQWGHEYLMGAGDCNNISNDRAYTDAINLMRQVKSTTHYKSFSEYFNAQKKAADKNKQENQRYCLDTASALYVFQNAPIKENPEWNYLIKARHATRGFPNIIGAWRRDGDDFIVNIPSDFETKSYTVNIKRMQKCD